VEYLCGAVCVLAVIACAAVGAWVILASIFRTHPADGSPPARFAYCPACDAELALNSRYCPECDLDLQGRVAQRLKRIETAEEEVEDLRQRGELDPDTAERVADRLDARRRDLLHPAPQSPRPAPAEPLPVAARAGVSPPAPTRPPVARPVPAEPPERPDESAVTPAPVAPPRRSVGEVLAEFMHERNILWGELVGGLLIVGCSIALVLSLWRSLEELPYFPFLLAAAITAAMFGVGEYAHHHWKLAATSRGMLVIALLLVPLNLLLLTDPGTRGSVGWVDAAVKVVAVLAFAGLVRAAGRDVLGEALPGAVGGRWLLTLAVVGAPATQLLPLTATVAEPVQGWLPLLCQAVACGVAVSGVHRRSPPLTEVTASAVLLFVGLATFALFASWGAVLTRSTDPPEALRGLAPLLVLAAVPAVAAGMLVHRRRVEPVGLRLTGTAAALAGVVAMFSALVIAWPDPLALLVTAAAAGSVLTAFAVRGRLAWLHLGALPNLGLAVLLGYHGLTGGWPAPDAGSLADRLTSAPSGGVLAVFALALAALGEFLARIGRRPDARVYAAGGAAAAAVALLVVSVRGLEAPFVAAGVHVLCAVGFVAAGRRWRYRAVPEVGVWLLLPATLWLMWAVWPDARDRWGLVVALEGLTLAVVAWGFGRFRYLRGACADVAGAAAVLAVALGLSASDLPHGEAHTGTLFAVAATGFVLAEVFTVRWLAWIGSLVGLVGLTHLTVYTVELRPVTLAVLVALVGHAAAAVAGALVLRGRLLADPLRLSGRLTSVLAVPLFLIPDPTLALTWVGLAVAVGLVWLALAVVWREPGGFPAFQAALTAAAALTAVAWVARQSWVEVSSLKFADPRAWQAYGLAVALLGLGWVFARRVVQRWSVVRPSVDQVALGTVVAGQLVLAWWGVLPAVVAELTPVGATLSMTPPAEHVHAWGPGAWALLAVLAVVLLLALRLASDADRRGHTALIGLAVLAVTAPLLAAGGFAPQVASASALRWGLAAVFVVGSVLLAVRRPLRRAAWAAGFPVPRRSATRAVRGLFAAAAVGVVVLTASVAWLGLTGQVPSGPAAGSAFDRMGWTASVVIPLALVVAGLAGTALRDRSAGYALAGGAVFAATLAGGYALGVVTAGGMLGSVELVRVGLLGSGGLAVWGLLWLMAEERVPGRGLLTAVVVAAMGGVAALAVSPLGSLVLDPGRPLGPAAADLGQFGWAVLVLATAAAVWHTQRAARELRVMALGYAAATAGVLAACFAVPWDAPGRWLSYHALAGGWAVAGLALTSYLARPNGSRASSVWPDLLALGLAVLALRAGWADPHRPLIPAGMALLAAMPVGVMAVRFGGPGRVYLSGLLADLAAVLFWAAWGPDTVVGFFLANAVGLGFAAAAWSVVGRAVADRRVTGSFGADAPSFPQAASWSALGLLLLGIAPTLAGNRTDPSGFAWGAAAAVGLALGAGRWDHGTKYAGAALYLLGVAVALLAVSEVHAEPVWFAWPTPVALAVFTANAGAATWVAERRSEWLRAVELPQRESSDRWTWFGPAQVALGLTVAALAVSVSLREPDLVHRLTGPLAVALLVPAAVFGMRSAPANWADAFRPAAVGLAVAAVGLVGWAVPDPDGSAVWLERNAWLFTALTVAAVAGAEFLPRLAAGTDWARDVRRVGGVAAVLAVVVLAVLIVQQILAFDPVVTRRTPLHRSAVLAVLAGIVALTALALRFALRPDHDPLGPTARGRTVYVYLAQVLVVLLFVVLRLNVPEVFVGQAVRYWTFLVMLLAFVGVGSAELFERRGIAVLAGPLRRTGVLLPLIPLLAFWAKPPGAVLEFADDRAPGLRPMLGYLEKLPQHYDTYAVLWLLAGLLYGLLALSRRSYGWALLAALATNASLWALWTHTAVPIAVHPQVWVIPLALIVLVSEHLHRDRLRPDVSAGLRYLGVAMIFVASAADMFIAGVGSSVWLPVVLAVLCVAGVLAGVLLRVRAFLFLGVGFLLLDLFAMIWHAAVDRAQTWLWYASGIVLGAAILAVFAVFEKRRIRPRAPLFKDWNS
jgi:hypothetical protein